MAGFTNKDVARITGLEPSKVAYYTKEGYVEPRMSQASVRWSNRIYSVFEIAEILIIHKLVQRGVPLDVITKIKGDWNLGHRSLQHNPLRTKTSIYMVLHNLNTDDPKCEIYHIPVNHDGFDLSNSESRLAIDITQCLRVAGEAEESLTKGLEGAPNTFDVARITGLEPSKVAYYTKEGYVEPRMSQASVRWSNRIYSVFEIAEILIIHKLVQRGVPLDVITKIKGDWNLGRRSLQHNPLKTKSSIYMVLHNPNTDDPKCVICHIPDPTQHEGEAQKRVAARLNYVEFDLSNSESRLAIDITQCLRVAGEAEESLTKGLEGAPNTFKDPE